MLERSKPPNETVRDEIVAQLASTSLLGRFSVSCDAGWEICFNGLSSAEFRNLIDIAAKYLNHAKVGLGQGSVRWINLTDFQAREFAFAVASAFQTVFAK
jgi:hypothetical protein